MINFFKNTIALALTIGSLEAQVPQELGTRPESITRGFDGDLFVSVMSEKEPGDAVIKRLDSEGKLTVFAGGMDEPKGIAFVGEHLVVSDLGRVWKINKKGEASILAHRHSFPKQIRFLNDVVAVPGEAAVYVTDMGSNHLMFETPGKFWALDSEEAKAIPAHGRLYKVTLDGKVTEILSGAPEMRNPNGVGIGRDGQILIGGFFTGNLLEYRNGKLEVIASGFRGADAVEQDKDGIYYISSWTQGKVWSYDRKTKKTTVVKEGLQAAADFYFDKQARKLYCPDMLEGTLHTIALP